MDQILGVAIGVATVCLIFSIIASHLQEIWASFSARRASTLETALQGMLGDPKLIAAFFDHPLIQGMSFSPTRSSILRRGAPTSSRPSYIASAIFSKTLQSVVSAANHLPAAQFPEIIKALPDSSLKTRVMTLTAGLENDASAWNAALERWYDDTMERVNGVYKRHTQGILIYLGLILAIACNVNLLRVSQTLWTSAAAREEINAIAQLYGCAAGSSCTEPSYEAARADVQTKLTLLPLGYENFDLRSYWQTAMQEPKEHFGQWLYNLVGWLLTAVAVSLGAPFWFDVINKFINIRMVGQRPPVAKTRKSVGLPKTLAPTDLGSATAQVSVAIAPGSPGGVVAAEADDDADGCEVAVVNATPDEALPSARGGVG